VRVCLIRHASTGWNEDGRIQGRTDIPLSAGGREQATAWRLPPGFAGAACVTSPLSRARQTAELLGFSDPPTDDRLVEMAWGKFEGRTLRDLRAQPATALRELEEAGLDFRPLDGESPRMVADRLAACLRELALTGRDHVVITHKGVLRASLVLALGWDMLGKSPVRYEPELALIYALEPAGKLRFEAAVSLAVEQ
jgi:broad specificity phosphatase PhoE